MSTVRQLRREKTLERKEGREKQLIKLFQTQVCLDGGNLRERWMNNEIDTENIKSFFDRV